jgi:protein-tyrosine phosphatase
VNAVSSQPGRPSTDELGGRHLRIGAARNLRDVGGYPVAGGGSTRWRRLLRSDSLHDLSPADQAKLAVCGVRTVIDLRSLSEADAAPNRLIRSAVVRYVHVAFGDSPLVAPTRAELYCLALHRRQREFQTVFTLLTHEGVLPAVLQCSAGRDRTGLVVALVLALVGVPAEIIAADYALTTDSPPGEGVPVSAEPMLDTLRYLETSFGGVQRYLDAIGLTDRELSAIRTALVQ